MVTCKVSESTAVPKMNSMRSRKPASSSNSSGFRLLESDQLETSSSVSRNSVYKLKIDLMFDDTRSIRSHRLDDPRGSHRTRSIIMYGRSELASTTGDSSRSLASYIHESNETSKILTESTKSDVQRVSNSVQAQIEQLFTDVAKDATCSFPVTCLGSMPLNDKVTSLQGLQEPLRELYLNEMANKRKLTGFLDICATGLRVKTDANDGNITPFHNIAVWSAVKFVISEEDGGAAFLPLITDPENIDKSSLFQPLSSPELLHVASNNSHAPIFAVVMRSATAPKVLQCHSFICKSTEDAIVIAATLYQSLMAHVTSNSHRSTKRRTPRNQNGVSCISIASSSAQTGSNYLSRSQLLSNGRRNSVRSPGEGSICNNSVISAHQTSRSGRKKRVSNTSLNSNSNIINEAGETTTEERKRKSHKNKRAPPVPTTVPGNLVATKTINNNQPSFSDDIHTPPYIKKVDGEGTGKGNGSLPFPVHNNSPRSCQVDKSNFFRPSPEESFLEGGININGVGLRSETNGDILTRVAIPRSGSFLNTGGLTRYKSRAARRHSDKMGGGGGGGSPLGFSELFNEFRLHENLHSLDDILYAIIDSDGMSFNDLKPIYKEFLLKLAVTLTKDELFQRSKNIMRRQKKKKMKRKSNTKGSQKKPRTLLFGTKSLKKVFQFGQFRACRGKQSKQPKRQKTSETKLKLGGNKLIIGPPTALINPNQHPHQQLHFKQQQQQQNQLQPQQQHQHMHEHHHQQQQHHAMQHPRSRVATSGSDVSVIRNDHAHHGLNRNSSSGYVNHHLSRYQCYVSCSECSYDSETCTCISADRCYCSLRTELINNKLRQKNERNVTLTKRSLSQRRSQTMIATNRSSLVSCRSEDKCYCSLVEEEPNTLPEDDSTNTHSDTTWCDSDSCISASKCYCKRGDRRTRTDRFTSDSENYQWRQSRSAPRKSKDKLALDYELFTISGNGKPVQPHEALSVKKSVEAAAIFADVKLSQTTDIKSLCPPSSAAPDKSKNNCRSRSSNKNYGQFHKKRESLSTDRQNERNANNESILSTNSSHKSCSADDLLSKLSAIENVVEHVASIRNRSNKNGEIMNYANKSSFHNNYQSMRAVSASLEDTLGYLP